MFLFPKCLMEMYFILKTGLEQTSAVSHTGYGSELVAVHAESRFFPSVVCFFPELAVS